MVLEYAWLIPAVPLAAFVLVTLLGRWMPDEGGWLSAAAIVGSGALSVAAAWTIWQEHIEAFGEAFVWTFTQQLGQPWLEAGSFTFDMGLYVDGLTAWLLAAVGILTAGIAVYSIGYMRTEEDGYHLDDGTHVGIDGRQRYYAALALFVGSMLAFVLGSDLLQMFVFWELMGLCSYLLIGFWYAKPSAAEAAQKAFLVTRVGDVFFLGGLVMLAVLFGSTDLRVLLDSSNIEAVASSNGTLLGTASLLLFIGAVGKSAQLPLHVWLPDAMEGPTTVSALIHAATMVKAGVYLVARFMPIFAEVTWVLTTVAVVGALTAFVAATMACVNPDIKRVLAFSTISQLGYMFLGLGAVAAVSTGFATGLLHLFNHAFFKALLFLCAGAVGFAIHSYDMREFGGLAEHMPITAGTMLVATLAIAGIPPFSGFWSKDVLLESVYEASHGEPIFLALWGLAVLTAGLTAYYMFRLWFSTFLGDYRGDEDESHLHDGTWHMNLVLLVLALFAIGSGFAAFYAEKFFGLAFGHEHLHVSIGHIVGSWKAWVSLLVALGGVGLAWTRFKPGQAAANLTAEEDIAGLERVLVDRYYVTEAYYWVSDKVVVGLACFLDALDSEVVDWFVDALGGASSWSGGIGSRLQSGRVSDYAVGILSGLLVLVVVVVYVLRYTLGGGL
jgi:NADH-quinone oxidoreductase subunit L